MGETGRTTNKTVKEHKAACRLANFEKSAVAEHAWQDGHIIEWDQVTILDTASDQRETQMKEALWLNAIKNSKRAKRGQRRGREEIDGRGQGLVQCRRPRPQSQTLEDRRSPSGHHTPRPLPPRPAPHPRLVFIRIIAAHRIVATRAINSSGGRCPAYLRIYT